MTNSEVRIDARYVARISDKLTIVKIVAKQSLGKGWTAVNCSTGHKVQIRSGQKLRREVSAEEYEQMLSEQHGV